MKLHKSITLRQRYICYKWKTHRCSDILWWWDTKDNKWVTPYESRKRGIMRDLSLNEIFKITYANETMVAYCDNQSLRSLIPKDIVSRSTETK